MQTATVCLAMRAWLAAAPNPDPALAAAADLLERGLDPRRLGEPRADAADAHALLGAHALDGLLDLVQTLHS
jgi:hypothetical protein